MKKTLFNWVLVLSLGVMTQCGGSSSGTSDDTDDDTTEVADDVAATNGTVSAVTDSVNSLVGTFSGGGGGALTKFSTTDEEEEMTVECNDDYTSCTYSCEGGGSITETFDDAFEETECDNGDGTTGFSFAGNTTGTMVFDECVMNECGTTVMVDGEFGFQADWSYDDCNQSWSFEGVFSIADGDGICGSNFTAIPEGGSAVNMMVEMTYTASGDMEDFEESLSGQMGMAEADAAECDINTFASWEELEALIDSAGTCEAAEEAEETDCLTSEEGEDACESEDDDDSDDACDSCMETCLTDNPDASEDECFTTCTDDGSCSEDDSEDHTEEESEDHSE